MPSDPDGQLVWGLAAALLIGALVGIEREKNKRESGDVGIGGVRTFILLALSGATAAWLSRHLGSPWVFAVGLLGVAALAVAGYLAQARVKPRSLGLTTEISTVFVYLLGGACVLGYTEVALALGVAASAVLAYKQPLHDLVARLGTEDIEAGVKLLAATFIVLPLLPREAVDPWGAIEPYTVWLLVILIAGLSLVGYVATRALGPHRGAAVTGLAGGRSSRPPSCSGSAWPSFSSTETRRVSRGAGVLGLGEPPCLRRGARVARSRRLTLGRHPVCGRDSFEV